MINVSILITKQLILFTRPNKKKSWLASLFSDFDGWVGGFNFYFSYFLIFFLFVQNKGEGWVSTCCFISHTLTTIKLLFFSIYSISYEVYLSVDMKNTFSCCNFNNFIADPSFHFHEKSMQLNKNIKL